MHLPYDLVIEILISLQNVAVAIVGKDTPLKELTEEEAQVYLDMVLSEERRTGGAGGSTGSTGPSDSGTRPSGDGEPPQDPVPQVAMDTQ